MEPATPASLFTGYVVPLAAIGPIAAFIGLSIIGVSIPFVGTIRTSFVGGIVHAIISFAFALLGVGILAWVIDAIAPTFDGRKNFVQALKVAAYSYTPAFVAGILLIFPPLAPLQFLAALYGLFLLFLGLPILMQAPAAKAFGYTAAVVVCAFLIGIVTAVATTAVRASTLAMFGPPRSHISDQQAAAAGAIVAGAIGAAARQAAANSAHTADEANTSGATTTTTTSSSSDDAANAQAVAGAAKVVGALVTGGKNVTVVDYHALKNALPEAADGMTRTDAHSETKKVGGISASTATATYSDGKSGSLRLEITDMGNMSGLLSLGSMAMGATESESDTGYEKNVTIGGQRVHEKYTKAGNETELVTIAGDRFMVQVNGSGVDVAAAEHLLGQVDAARLVALTR
jgi:hypothetical protein